MRLLSWNLHGFVGTDGVFDAARVARAVEEMAPHIAVFQEVDLRRHGTQLVEPLQRAVGEHSLAAQAIGDGDRWYGQLLASRYPVRERRIHDISYKDYEPRRVIDAMIDTGEGMLRVLGTHLGLKGKERRWQLDKVCRIVEELPDVPVLFTGDLNEWTPRLIADRALGQDSDESPRLMPTFPSWLPILPLDRVAARPKGLIADVRTERKVRRYSDHLPLLVELDPSCLR